MKLPAGERIAIFALVVLVGMLVGGASSAFAYDELTPSSTRACGECHGREGTEESTATVAPTRKGPHGGYTTGTNKCATCHSVHGAAGYIALLPAATIRDTCLSCHDGTGGRGVYGVLAARGLTVQSGHRVDATNTVPGGAPDGTDAPRVFSGTDGLLTCSDCHSPHDTETVDPFTGDRARESTPAPFAGASAVKTNRLLRRAPSSATTSVTVYGSSWCGTCHEGRLSGSDAARNHRVSTETAGFWYDSVLRVSGPNTSTVETSTLGGSNRGYVMPTPRDPRQADNYPICQQCHEDSRSIGDDPANPGRISTQNGFSEDFRLTAADGANTSDNPAFQVFPHESAARSLLVEEQDDLCLNCHLVVSPYN